MPTFSATNTNVKYAATAADVTVIWDSFEQTAITSISATVDATITGGSPSSFEIEAYLPDVGGAAWYGVEYRGFGLGIVWPTGGGTISLPAGSTRVQIRAYCRGGYGPNDLATITVNGSWSGSAAPTTFCAYGTQANPDATIYQLVTDSLIDLVVGAVLAGTANAEFIPAVETFLAAIEGGVWLGVNCDTMPVGNTNLDLHNPATITRENLLSWFQNAAWHFFCQCTPAPPGMPDPVPPELPTVQLPPGLGSTQPPIVCDNTDICTFLAALKTELQQVLAQLSYLRADVTLIQRQKVPFSYVPGTLHSGLTGAGQFAVQGILGLAVQVTTVPGASGEQTGDPIARFGLGWVTTGTQDGWRKSVPIRANPQWVDAEPDDTLVGYSLEPLVVANIAEFAREP